MDATPQEVDASNQQELVEKTAAVAVIGRTIAEIEAIDGASPEAIKTAAQSAIPDQAVFIKAALDAGHSPHRIAEFMEKNAIFARAGRYIQRVRATRKRKALETMQGRVMAGSNRNLREWQDLIRKSSNASPQEKARLLSRMRRDLGDQTALNAFTATKGHKFKDVTGFADLKKSVPAQAAQGMGSSVTGKPVAAGISVGGKQVGLTKEQLNKMKKPALYAGAGYMGHRALGGGGGDKKSPGRGPVIVTG